MKKLLSLVLAFSMVCSAFAPAVYAEEPAPASATLELTAGDDGVPAQEDTVPATPAPADLPEAAEPTAEPTETPVAEQPTAEPTVEPTAEPAPTASTEETPAPTQTPAPTETPAPTAEPLPSQTPAPIQVPAATEPAEENAAPAVQNEVAEGSIVLYYDEATDVYFGKLPAEPNEEGWLEIYDGYLSNVDYDWKQLLYQNDAYWLFFQADQAPQEGATYSYTVSSDGETSATDHPAVFSTEEPAERPAYMYRRSSGYWVNFQVAPQKMPVQAGNQYSFQISTSTSGWTVIGVEGQGVDVVSQPDENGSFTLYYPDTMKSWVTESGVSRAILWVYAQNENGELYFGNMSVPCYPGQIFTDCIKGDVNWYDLTSEEGVAFTAEFYTGDGNSITSWAELGTVDSDAIQVELLKDNSEAYPGAITASYDAESDCVRVKLDELPDTEQYWTLRLTVPFEEGYSLQSATWNVSKKHLNLGTQHIDLVLGTKAGATFRTQVRIYDEQSYEYVDFISDQEWTVTFNDDNYSNQYKIVMAEGESLNDYIGLSFDPTTGILTATAKKDITLAGGEDYADLCVEMECPAQYASLYSAVSVGMAQMSFNQVYPNWMNLTEGVDLAPYVYDGNGNYVPDWSQYGTPTGEVSAKLRTYHGDSDWSEHVSAVYDAERQVINVRLDTLPEDTDTSWKLNLYIPCSEGYTLLAQQNVGKASLQIQLDAVNGLGNLGLTAGSSVTYTVTDTTDYANKKPLLLDDSWTITLNAYSGNFVMEDGEDIYDYVQAEAVDGKLMLTVLKDLTLQEGMSTGSIRVGLDSKIAAAYGDTISAGAADLNISLRDENGNTSSVELSQGSTVTLYPSIYRNNAYVTLHDLGLDYELEICDNATPMENWQEYFDLAMNDDGSFTVTVVKVPPIYDYASNASKTYTVKILSPTGDFFSNSSYSFANAITCKVKLRQNGNTVYTLPTKAGTYVYDFALQTSDYSNPQELELTPGVEFRLSSDMYGSDWNSSLFEGKYSLSLDTASKKLTYTVKEDLSDAVSLSMSGYWGNEYYFSDRIDVGRTTINLEAYRTDGTGNSSFKETNTQYAIVANTGHNYLSPDALKAENFILTAFENGTEIPLAESAYFDATIEDGILTVIIKQHPDTTNSSSYGIEMEYEDDTYVTEYSDRIYYSPFNVSSGYYTLSFNDMNTGSSVSRIPVGAPGTTDSYRVMTSGTQYAAAATGGALTGFVVGTTAPLDINDYVTVTYNATNSVLSFEWLKELPLRSEDGSVVYDYTLQPQGIQSSTTQLFKYDGSICNATNGNWVSPMLVSRGGSSQFVVEYPVRPDSLCYTVTDENGQPVGTDQISLSTNEFGGFIVTAGADCPEGIYSLSVSALLAYKGDEQTLIWQTSSNSPLKIKVTAEPLSDITYEMVYTSRYGYSHMEIMDGGSISIYGAACETYTLRLPEGSPATDFTIEGLTMGTATKVEDGIYSLKLHTENLSQGNQSEELTLTATLADGTRESCKVTLAINMPEVSFQVVDGDNTYETTSLFQDSIWTVGKEYQIYPRLNGQKISEIGASLENAFLSSNEYYKVTDVAEDCFTIVPQTTYSKNSSSGGYLFLNIRLANGDMKQANVNVSIGKIIANGARLQFVNADSNTLVTSIMGYTGMQDFTLRLNETLGAGDTVTYGSTVPDSVTWEEVEGEKGTVKVHVADYLGYSGNYFYAIVTRADGSQTSAYVEVKWGNYGSGEILPTGQNIYFGTKGEDNAYDHWSGSSMNRVEGATSTSKLYVFFGKNYNGVEVMEDWPSCVEGIEVTSSNPEMLRILRQGKENGMWFFEYQCDKSSYGNYYITATVQITDGTTRQATYRVTVSEAAQQNAITIQNGEELEKALASATLLPGMFIYAEPGTYEGDFLVDMPVKLFAANLTSITYNADGSLQPRENGVVIKGSMTAIAEEVNVNGFDFVGTGTGTALTDPQIVQNCTFTNYETAVELEKNVHNSNSPTIWNNAFADNGTAVRFVTHEWYTNLTGNTFWHNDVALEFAPACGIEGSYSATFDAVTTRGSMIRNRFYLQDGQLALANRSLNQATVNLTYNYFAQGNNTKPQAAMFEGPAVYSPYYETPGMDSITTDESLEDNVAEGTTTSVLTLTSGQGTSNTGTADSALQLSDSKFEELKNSETVTDLQINVQSTSNETDVVWNFAKEDLKEDYEGDSVNLGVAFTFTDFEYDTINEIVRKTQEEWGTESETLGSIAYQAMCFSHSGDLPGTATVKIRMNESLLDYYANHGNSMDDFKIYYFNEETGVLEKMERNIEVVQENGTYYMQFQIDHCSSYLVTPEDLLEDVSGFIEIILNAGNNGGYTLIDALLERVLPGSTVQEVLSHLSGGTMTVRDLQNNVVDETAAIGTGFTIGLGDGTTSPIQVVIGGDLTGNGSINADDLLQMRRAIIKYVTLDGVWLCAATTVSQGSTPGDQNLLQMRRVLLGLADSMYVN